MELIEIFIVLSLVYLEISLLTTIIQEFIASIFALRGKMLLRAIGQVMQDEKTLTAFKTHSLFTSLSKGPLKDPPSYLSADAFVRILFRLPQIKGKTAQQIADDLPEGALKEAILSIITNTQANLQHLQEELKTWYNDYMDRVTGWYKRQTQWIVLAIGIILAVSMDVDTIEVYGRLKKDAGLRTEWVKIAEKTSTQAQSVKTGTLADSTRLDSIRVRMDSIRVQMNNFTSTYEPLGIGRQANECRKDSFSDCWLNGKKWLGWLLTALAVSLGAPFWFDLLKKFVQVRNAGVKPEEKKIEATDSTK